MAVERYEFEAGSRAVPDPHGVFVMVEDHRDALGEAEDKGRSEERERLRGVESALRQALMIVGEGLPGESERDSTMRVHAKWAVENALKDLAALDSDQEAKNG